MSWWRRRRDDDFRREIEAHIVLEVDRLVAEGMPPEDARTEARRRFGNVTNAQERFYESRRVLWLDHLRRDLSHAARTLWRSPGFAAVAILTLAIGMTGTTTMFALVQGVLLRPFPMPAPERLVVGWKAFPTTGMAHFPLRQPEVEAIRDVNQVFTRVAGVGWNDPSELQVVEGDGVSLLRTARVTGEFFDVLDLQPALGRTLGPADDAPGAERVLVLTDRAWQLRYGRDPTVIGSRLTVNDASFVIVGVMPPDVEYPRGTDAWTTVEAMAATWDPAFREAARNELDVLARLRPGVALDQAREALGATLARLEATAPVGASPDTVPVLQSFNDVAVGDVRGGVLVLFGLVGFVLLIASTNVANLLLVRGDARRAELSVRAALGAGRARLIAHVVAESTVLVFLAAATGLVVTWASLQGLVALAPSGLPRIDAVRIDAGVAAFVVALVFVTVALAGLAPAWSATRVSLVDALHSGARPGGRRTRRRRYALVAAQVALAVVVVAAAGLLTQSAWRLQATGSDLGADSMTLVSLTLPQGRYAERETRLRFLNELVARVEAVPGVAAATPINALPFSGVGWDVPTFTIEGQDAVEAARNPTLTLEAIHPGYFETFGVEMVRGRVFTATDRQDGLAVAIVSQDVAARAWPGDDPLGRRIKMGQPGSPSDWLTIVGVARRTRYRDLRAPQATLYVPAEQFIVSAQSLVVRTTSPGGAIAESVRRQVQELDPSVRVTRVSPFAELLQQPLARPRFYAFLVGLFGAAALALASVGLYAIIATSVRQRYGEIGVRMALGASSQDVRREVLGEGIRLALVGAGVGLLIAIATGRLLTGLLYEVSPLDPRILAGAALAIVAAATCASYLPARSAARTDPSTALRTN